MSENLHVSIIIPSLHSSSIEATLQAIALQSAFSQITEIIIAGQQNISDSIDIPGLVYLPVDVSPTPARNRNAGAQRASGDILCFTDSDCVPHPDWVKHLLTTISHAEFVAGAVDVPANAPYWSRCDHILGFENQAVGIANAQILPYAATLNFSCRRDLFLSLHGFSESFVTAGGEDREFCWRLQKAGYKIMFEPAALVVHNHIRKDFHSAWRHIYHYGQVTSQFRLSLGEDVSWSWRLNKAIAKTPLLGEFAGVGRVLALSVIRILRHPALLQNSQYLPGIAILNLAHTLGMIQVIRTHVA